MISKLLHRIGYACIFIAHSIEIAADRLTGYRPTNITTPEQSGRKVNHV